MLKNQSGFAGIIVLIAVAVTGLVASGTVTGLDKGKPQINEQVVKERKAVDYSKMNQ